MLKDKLSYSTTPLGSIYVAADVKCYCKIHFRQHNESHNCWQCHVCEFWGFGRRVVEDFVPPGYDASVLGSHILMFRRNVLTISSRAISSFFYNLLTIEDEVSQFLQNVRIQFPCDEAPYRRRMESLVLCLKSVSNSK
jgi:hypothetical protein